MAVYQPEQRDEEQEQQQEGPVRGEMLAFEPEQQCRHTPLDELWLGA